MKIYLFKIIVLAMLVLTFIVVIIYNSGLWVRPAPYTIDWRRHPVIVFESDDWGTARLFANSNDFHNSQSVMQSARQLESANRKEVVESLTHPVTLETPEDMELIFSILKDHVGGDGVHPVVTANYVLHSPDYEKIEKKSFDKFYSLRHPEVSRHWQRGNYLETATDGVKLGVWQPEYHGMLHMNPYKWISLLGKNDFVARSLFSFDSYAGMNSINGPEYSDELTVEQQQFLIDTGYDSFREVFGYHANSSIAPFYVWQSRTEKILSDKGVKVIQAKNMQNHGLQETSIVSKLIGKILNYIGYKSSDKFWQIEMGDYNVKLDLIYLNRNVYFEPVSKKENIVDQTVNDIKQAWAKNQPAVLNTHRSNYVSLDVDQTKKGLSSLNKLLSTLEQKYPNISYLTDWELSQLYSSGYSVRHYGETTIIRNFTDMDKKVKIELPNNSRITNSYCAPSNSSYDYSNIPGGINVTLTPHTTCKLIITANK